MITLGLEVERRTITTAIFVFLNALVVFCTGCSSKFETMSDQTLADGMHECRATSDQSPGFAIRCDNFERECNRRREDGHFVC